MITFSKCKCQVHRGKFSINDIPLNCPAVWRLLASGHTVGVFQLETNLGQEWAKKARPDSIEELAALVSILRPGPLESKMSQDYVDVKFGRKEISYLHPSLEPILSPTFGCLVYQEQAIRIATDIAGLSPESADELRKAIGKKKPELMAKVKSKFISVSQKHGIIDKDMAEEIFGWIEKCQRYSFNKSHALSYGMIAYQTAWLKAHFPYEFFTSYLTYSHYKSDPKEEVYRLVQDSRLFGVEVMPPDIRRGNVHFQIIEQPVKNIAFGLSHIRGVGTSAIQKIVSASLKTPGMDPLDQAVMEHGGSASVAARTETGNTISGDQTCSGTPGLATWANFLASVPVFHRNVGIALIKSGACDCYNMNRSEMVRELEVILGTTVRNIDGKKVEVKGLTEKERGYFFNQLSEESMTTREILLQMSQPPGDKIKKIGQMAKPELITAAIGYLNQADVAFDGIVDGDNKLIFGTDEQKDIWMTGIGKRTKQGIAELMSKNGYQDVVVKPPCTSDARRTRVATKAELLEKPINDTNTTKAIAEKYFLGISLSCSQADDADSSLATHTCLEIAKSPNNEKIVVCAIIDTVRHTKTKKGNNPGQPMCFLTISDSTYSIDRAVVFPDSFGKLKELCKDDLICLIYGEKKNGSFIIRGIQKLM